MPSSRGGSRGHCCLRSIGCLRAFRAPCQALQKTGVRLSLFSLDTPQTWTRHRWSLQCALQSFAKGRDQTVVSLERRAQAWTAHRWSPPEVQFKRFCRRGSPLKPPTCPATKDALALIKRTRRVLEPIFRALSSSCSGRSYAESTYSGKVCVRLFRSFLLI